MDQIFKFINGLNSAQRSVIIGGFSILFLFLIGLLIYSSVKANDAKLNYTIASNLTKNQIMLASNELEAAGIPFTIIGNGNSLTLKTSKANVNIAKIKLVTSEAIVSKHTGWEIFDKSSLGTTNFENNVKLLRATEGELGRSLEALNGILSATVKIAIPKESVFTQRKAEPTASAILTLRDGATLTGKQIAGIKNFIASAIPKLKASNIKLINQNGSLLEDTQINLDNQKYLAHARYKSKIEKSYEEKIINLLEPFIGVGKVVARVSVTMDYTNQQIEQEIFQPEGTIRSQQTTESTSTSEDKKPKVGGVPGVQSNIQNPDEKDGEIKSKTSNEKAKNITNYEISKKIIHQKDNSVARIKRITAAVTFDSTVMEKVDKKDEFISSIESIVEESIGVDVKRGDTVTIKSFKFIGSDSNSTTLATNDIEMTTAATKTVLSEYSEYIQYLISAILLLVFYKKFISNNEVNLTVEGSGSAQAKKEKVGVADEDFEYEDFNPMVSKNRLKNKIRTQLLSNVEGLDPETLAKYEVLLEEIETQVNNQPEAIAGMIEMLLSEGDSKLKAHKKG
jgi:flagellar M-ring protein FliF